MWWAAFGISLGLAPVVMTMVHLRRLQRLAGAQLSTSSKWGEVLQDLHANVAASTSWRARVAACDDASSTVEGWLNVGPLRKSGWRICIASGMAAGCALISTTLQGAAVCLVWGVLCAGLTAWLAHQADSVAGRLRGQWNTLIRSLGRSFPEDAA